MNKDVNRRIALVVEFCGDDLSGWQRQEGVTSVQQYLEEALGRVEGDRRTVVAAGRTDAGVHAEALLVHVDVDAERWLRAPRAYLHGVNGHLPAAVRVVGVAEVAADFHARFACRERSYRYQIWNRQTAPAIWQWRHWWMPRQLDVAKMQAAGELLLGRHDFSSFRASGCQSASAVRELRELCIEQQGCEICVHLRADAFLYHMVRNIVGNLVRVGVGAWPVERIAALLAERDRRLGAATAPAHGLYFTDARYDDFSARALIGRCGGAPTP